MLVFRQPLDMLLDLDLQDLLELRGEVRKKMEERGIAAYDENGRLRLPFDVIADLGEWSGGDMRRLGEIFTDLEQLTALVPMMRPGGQEQDGDGSLAVQEHGDHPSESGPHGR